MILDDFTVLGKTVPEPNKTDDRTFVCSAGISPEFGGLVRIYPLAVRGAPHRWTTYRVPVELNPRDNRRESRRIAGDRHTNHEMINHRVFHEVGQIPKGRRVDLLRKVTVDSIKQANVDLRSLAIIHPEWIELYFDHNPESPESPMLALFDVDEPRAAPIGAKRFAYVPRLRFADTDGRHDLALRDWGCFEYMRKQGDARRHDLTDTLPLTDQSSLLVGNHNHHRNSWLVISVLNGIRDEQQSLFD